VRHRCEAAVLDLGGVLVEIDFRRAFAVWARAAGVPAEALAEKFSFDAAYCAHERGEISEAKYFSMLRTNLGIDISDDSFLAGWNAIFGGPMPGAERALRELARRMPLYVFSNTNPAHVAYFGPRYRELLSPVTKVVTSCDIGRRKPEPEAFRRMTAIIGIAPSRLAFFDDLEENVAGARAAGLQARRVARPQEILDALEGSSVSRPDDRRGRS
jgi:FMN phosphatase YigB (HAD superfamily)